MASRRHSKSKGTKREHQARRALELRQFYVIRAAGSHGVVDLVAVGSWQGVRMVQVKSNRWPRSPEMQELRELARRFNSRDKVDVEIWRYDDQGVKNGKVIRPLRVRHARVQATGVLEIRFDSKTSDEAPSVRER